MRRREYRETVQLIPSRGTRPVVNTGMRVSVVVFATDRRNVYVPSLSNGDRMNRRRPAIPLKELENFVRVVRRLRRECPWDRKQTHRSIRDMLIEEAYEVVEAIDEGKRGALSKELGDVLLHVVMHATIAEETGAFSLKTIVEEITAKLIRRHPHVFGSLAVRNAAEVRKNWEELKMSEGRKSVLEGVPKGLPALQQAARLQERAAGVGFDWERAEDVWHKIEEELREFRQAIRSRSRKKQEEELGDFLFSLVNYSRFLGINPESALRVTIRKFNGRFRSIERELRKQGRDIRGSSLAELDGLWNRAKVRHRKKVRG
jgi:MazG family protein